MTLGEYRQLQMLGLATIDLFMDVIVGEFLGYQANHKDAIREEFFQLKCCSFKRKDLEKHFQKAAEQYYQIGGPDDVNLKQAYLGSIPDSLAQDTLQEILKA